MSVDPTSSTWQTPLLPPLSTRAVMEFTCCLNQNYPLATLDLRFLFHCLYANYVSCAVPLSPLCILTARYRILFFQIEPLSLSLPPGRTLAASSIRRISASRRWRQQLNSHQYKHRHSWWSCSPVDCFFVSGLPLKSPVCRCWAPCDHFNVVFLDRRISHPITLTPSLPYRPNCVAFPIHYLVMALVIRSPVPEPTVGDNRQPAATNRSNEWTCIHRQRRTCDDLTEARRRSLEDRLAHLQIQTQQVMADLKVQCQNRSQCQELAVTLRHGKQRAQEHQIRLIRFAERLQEAHRLADAHRDTLRHRRHLLTLARRQARREQSYLNDSLVTLEQNRYVAHAKGLCPPLRCSLPYLTWSYASLNHSFIIYLLQPRYSYQQNHHGS